MKQIILICLSIVTLFVGCSKKVKSEVEKEGVYTNMYMVTTSSSLTIGEMHNQVVTDWMANYFTDADPSTKTGYAIIVHQVADIMNGYGWLPDTPQTAVENLIMDFATQNNFFDGNGNTKSIEDILKIEPLCNLMTPEVISFVDNINNWTGSDHNQFNNDIANSYNALPPSLNSINRQASDEVYDVFTHSHDMWVLNGPNWNSLNYVQKVIVLAKADAFGAWIGINFAVREMHETNPVIIEAWARIYATVYSITATKL